MFNYIHVICENLKFIKSKGETIKQKMLRHLLGGVLRDFKLLLNIRRWLLVIYILKIMWKLMERRKIEGFEADQR
jgi:hypothetical protein